MQSHSAPHRATAEQKAAFARTGAVAVRKAVPRAQIDRIHRDLLEWLVQAPDDPDAIAAYTRRTFAEDMSERPEILALFYDSPLVDLASSLVEPLELENVERAQVQVRLPERAGGAAQPEKPVHVDGLWCGHLPSGTLNSFSMLVGIAASQVATSSGPLRFIPGGHLLVADWIRTHGDAPPGDGYEAPEPIRTKLSQNFVAEPGDAIILHYLCPHAAGLNRLPNPRVMIYFRLKVVDHDGRVLLADPFADFPSLRRNG
ncbi:Phytanoyl-CoA dioxygenase (PhyH) [Gaiella occulta]|uniref:Phytanoyl-CoA dioxygenase (PhyH) n=1 Tax=Gaiella occulta TaxID=1002870 RepID=A0A7M2YUH8_9ACTN|nr:phytanoyl-CoA dioxygenase family protein [Gaiella occulta]RDI73534.1 Phytanoyl-CoA dioxygenase (PhyH) [Gaiella occulta]